MSRRRSLPWIYRWSRPIISTISIVGALLTAYLTVNKLTGSEVACVGDATASGCSDVLSSAYASVFGLPLPLFGFLAYSSMASFALVPLAINRDTSKSLRTNLENWTWLLLLVGATSMATFSAYLMYILATKLQATCIYCISSAIFALSLLILTVIGREWEDLGQILFTGLIVSVITLVGALGIYAPLNSPAAQGGTIPQATGSPQAPDGWKINTTSGAAEIALAQHLTAIGAKKYGAFWCPHCYDQKQLFGQQAFAQVNYIECADGGKNAQPQACREAGVQSFPTWEINGEKYPGTQTLERLAELSGYQGLTDFKYNLPGR